MTTYVTVQVFNLSLHARIETGKLGTFIVFDRASPASVELEERWQGEFPATSLSQALREMADTIDHAVPLTEAKSDT